MSDISLKEKLQVFGLSKVLEMIQNNPEKNMTKVLNWSKKLDKENTFQSQMEVIQEILDDKDNNWHKFIDDALETVDREVLGVFFRNFAVYSSVIGFTRQQKLKEQENCNIPWAILLDPTSACNLSCTGCWAAEYGDSLNMDYDTLNSIITQGKEMGTYMYIYSGGEPLVRKEDIIRLCEEHEECMFLAFTNGTLIDEAFADEMLRVKNFVPAISIEGFEEATDQRRGEGTFKEVVRAMKLLREKKLIYGASCCYTSANTDVIGSEEFIDYLIEEGAKFAWFFTYMPVGVGAPVELLATAPQREFMFRQIREFRETKPIFTMDFWNDGQYVGGCIAGGRCYMHINANGDIEPCAFIHYSDSNIHEKTLLEAYKSPLFMQYHNNQPFNENMLRPCPLLDNENKLAEMVHRSDAHSTDVSSPENVDTLCGKCKEAQKNWTPAADRLWSEELDRIKTEKENVAV